MFIYWGWDSGVAVNEESRDNPRPGQGRGRLDLLPAADLRDRRGRGPGIRRASSRPNNSSDVLNALGKPVFGSPLDKLLIIAVLSSASASTQTTILPDRSHHPVDGALEERSPRRSARCIRGS